MVDIFPFQIWASWLTEAGFIKTLYSKQFRIKDQDVLSNRTSVSERWWLMDFYEELEDVDLHTIHSSTYSIEAHEQNCKGLV